MSSAHFSTNHSSALEKVCIIGSGNWGSAVAKIVGGNVTHHEGFDQKVNMWVFEEQFEGQPLTRIINARHENVKYLPGIRLPPNVHAEPDLARAARDASLLIFVLPHQFIAGACRTLKEHRTIRPGAKAISLVKGLAADETSSGSGPCLVSSLITKSLNGIDVSVLSGANIANEIAEEKFSETTIGYRNRRNGELFYQLFNTPYFQVNIVNDPCGVELCGALKNIVAIGAGMVDGLGLGENTKAAIIRIGLMEMMKFAKQFDSTVRDDTFFESCGIADVITTCAGGRNRRVGEAFVRTGKSFEELEREMLNGQKLQGTSTCQDVCDYLSQRNRGPEFPLFMTIHDICFRGLAPENITKFNRRQTNSKI
ncbi:glycerol-3-phosphate dehydrogenase [Tieghemiomyces parasiticus]|uniref:Glycerol-3-phosphate dehydrogenase [NAD(+)] n=1 Tax=Tieghemiomyces parasiticus TaxID=78921 RepID=A0A9W8DHJ2_9FUNG|nr:glycerol-3-phosphate dehydrogenase [Tieghemiomyces parasiticus]